MNQDDIDTAVSDIIRQGYAVMPMPADLRQAFTAVPSEVARLSDSDKAAFSFPSQLDGFLPFGSEHAEGKPDHPDLCERFCYFRKNMSVHLQHTIAAGPFYQAVVAYEEAAAALTTTLLDALFSRLGGTAPKAPGGDSYVQLCRYLPEYSGLAGSRAFLMDPHIDGQLLTLISQTEQGLNVGALEDMRPVHFNADEVFVMAGQLLELATDGEVKGVLHGVSRGQWAEPRTSLIYFQNPCFDAGSYPSLRHRKDIDFYAVANAIHTSYGNPSYKD